MKTEHWVLIASIVGGAALQLATVHMWADVVTPAFIAGLLLQVAAGIRAVFAGSPNEEKKDAKAADDLTMANASTKAALQIPIDTTKVDPKRYLGSESIDIDLD